MLRVLIPTREPCTSAASRSGGLQRPERGGPQGRLIAHREVTNAGNDSGQLAAQAIAAKEVLGVEALTVVADAGYYSEAELAACAQANIAVSAAIPDKHRRCALEGRFSGAQFQYVAGADAYVCPGGGGLRPQGKPAPIYGILRQRYTRPPTACQGCPLKCVCLPGKTPRRQLYRSQRAAVAEAHRQRMAAEGAERMRQRAGLVEHPFGTLKRWFGWDHLLARGFAKVRGEMPDGPGLQPHAGAPHPRLAGVQGFALQRQPWVVVGA